jgi:hypothetical protein
MALWTPASITTALWLDASDATTITESGGLVSEWRDKSGLGRHASEANSVNQPALTTAGMNGLDCLTFTNHQLAAPGVHITTNAMFFAVATLSATSPAHGRLLSLRQTGQTYDFNNAGSILPFYRYSATTTVQTFFNGAARSSVTVAYDTNMLLECVVNTSSMTTYLNGAAGATGTVTHALNTSDGLLICQSLSPNDENWYGKVAEIVIVEGVDTDTRQYIEGYLAWKWGLEANLPSGHPYITAAPVAVAVSGIITDDNNLPCQRTIRAYNRATGALLGSTTSDPSTGAYSFTFASTDEVQLVALDDAAGTVYNDKILRVTPS